jgi:hypothetical protein
MGNIKSPDLSVEKWLRSLKPRAELTARYALRAKYSPFRNDSEFSARITALLRMIHADSVILAAILTDARKLESHIAEELAAIIPDNSQSPADRQRSA